MSEAFRPRVLIADLPAIRLGVQVALDGAVEVCAEAGDAEATIAAAEREQPEICLIGLDLPGDGIVAIRGIRAVAPGTAVIALASSQDADDLLACVHAGAVGYLPGSIGPESLRRVVAAVGAGEAAVPRALVLVLLRELQRAAQSRPSPRSGRGTRRNSPCSRRRARCAAPSLPSAPAPALPRSGRAPRHSGRAAATSCRSC